MEIPCLIISYARSANVLILIEALRHQGISKFYIAIDGPCDSTVQEIQSDFVDKLVSLGMEDDLAIQIWLRNVNLGIAVSVITALDWFFRSEEFGIIIEDDLKVSPDFTKFVIQANQMRTKEVALLSGNRFFADPVLALHSKYPATWGWATWRDEWKQMRCSITEVPKPQIRHFFTSDYQFWLLGALRVLLRRVDTWDIPISLYLRNNSKYSFLPSVNLVTNIGYDSFASHTHLNDFPLGTPLENFDTFELSSESIVQEGYDQKLRREVFKIRFRHRFLAIHLFWMYVNLAVKGNKLKSKINEVHLPD